MSLTLTEYLNQTEPIRKPKVILQEHEYEFGVTHKIGMEVHTQVFITEPQFVEVFGAIEYVLVGDNLYTTDSDGNKKNYSVFSLT